MPFTDRIPVAARRAAAAAMGLVAVTAHSEQPNFRESAAAASASAVDTQNLTTS
jgi:hypothetical protein